MGFSIGDLYLTLFADGGRLKQSIEQEANKAAAAAGDSVGKTFGDRMAEGLMKRGKQLQQTGTTLIRNVTVPILGIGSAIVSVGVDFDTTLRQIVALTDVTADEIGGIRSEILELAKVVGKDPRELARGFYFLRSAGFDTAESLEVLKVTAKAAASGLGETADISKIVGAAINAFGKENLTAEDAVDQLIRAVNVGTAEAPEFAGALGDVLGSAAQMGAKFNDVAAAIAVMTKRGISADESATSLNQVFLSLLKTTPAAEEALEGLGLSSEGLRQELREKGLLSVLQTLSDKFEGNETAAAAVFGNVRALRGVLALTGGDAQQTAADFEAVANGTQNLAQAFADTEGPGREMARAWAEIQVALIELASDVLPQLVPILKTVVGFISTGVKAFKALPEPVRAGIVQLAALAAVMGPLLFIGGKFASGLGLTIKAFKTLTTLGKGLVPIISKVVGNLALGGTPGVGDITKKTGGFLGSTLGKAFSVGFAAIAIVEVLETYTRIKGELDAQLAQINTDAQNQLKAGTDEALAQQKAGLEQGIEQLNSVWDLGIFTNDARDKLTAELDATNAEIARRAALAPEEVARQIAAGKDEVAAAAGEGLAEPIESALDRLIARARAAGRNVPDSLAGGILEEQAVVPDALAVLRDLIKHELTPAGQIARDIGILTSKELAEGLKDKREGVRTEAERVQSVAEQELAELIRGGGKVGKKAMDELKEALHSKNPDVRRAAERVRDLVGDELDGTERRAYKAGKRAGRALQAGLVAAIVGKVVSVAINIAASLPGFAEGGPVAAGQPIIIGEQGPEIFVPDTPGTILPNDYSSPGGGAGAAAGATVNLYMPDAKNRDPFKVLERASRLARWGQLTPSTEPAGG